MMLKYYIRLILLLFLLPGFLLASCSTSQGEISLEDHIIIFPSKYDGVMSDITSNNPSLKGFARICRSLEELLELCPVAGIEYGVDIPEYTDEWFEDNAIIILALFEGVNAVSGAEHYSNISVGKVTVDGSTAHVELYYINNAYDFFAQAYTIIIEVEAKHLVNVESVAPPVVKLRGEE